MALTPAQIEAIAKGAITGKLSRTVQNRVKARGGTANDEAKVMQVIGKLLA